MLLLLFEIRLKAQWWINVDDLFNIIVDTGEIRK